MKIAILSVAKNHPSNRRLKEACQARGHKARVFDTRRFWILVEQGHPVLYYDDKPLPPVDAVIPRIGHSLTLFGTALIRQLEQMGVFCLNSSAAITVSRDKLRAMQALSRHGVGLPQTAFVRDQRAVAPAIEQVGLPVIIKLLQGTQGIGVMLAEDPATAESIIETLHVSQQNVLIQKFIRESKGRDVRAFVVGGQVVGAVRRVAQGDEFRSNVHRGAKPEPFDLPPAYAQVAIQAAQILGLHVAGVDLLEGEAGPVVMEVNSSPGIHEFEKVASVDVAAAIVEHIEQQVQFPEVDLRQRLTLHRGHAVAEVKVGPRSALAGKTVAETGLRERDVLVLSILRGQETIPTPRGGERIHPGDVLVCSGSEATLRGLLPPLRSRKPKPVDGADPGREGHRERGGDAPSRGGDAGGEVEAGDVGRGAAPPPSGPA